MALKTEIRNILKENIQIGLLDCDDDTVEIALAKSIVLLALNGNGVLAKEVLSLFLLDEEIEDKKIEVQIR